MMHARNEIMPHLQEDHIDLLILDYLLGEGEFDSLQLVKQIYIRFPFLRVLISSSVESPAVVQLMSKAGARGFIGKSKSQIELIKVIRTVARGERYLNEDMIFQLDQIHESDKELHEFMEPRQEIGENPMTLKDLTQRELEVIRC
ncbi:response regulator transcription factor [Pantoea sp. B9002]|uniref:response regulator transcription factor n=1 Tax=Pantoea sp. B9002 TaxID=2726979 RepID=UPI0015A4A7E1|nr:response regulator transcription factor [Pantoea sp. B9002]NWA61593.1 response regulator transcription factor [Pantoea sp. B9002]